MTEVRSERGRCRRRNGLRFFASRALRSARELGRPLIARDDNHSSETERAFLSLALSLWPYGRQIALSLVMNNQA